MAKRTAARARTPASRRTGKAASPRPAAVKLSKADLKVIDDGVDRYIERWARRLLIVEKGKARRLTEEEVEAAVGRKPAKAGRASARPRRAKR